MLNISFAEKEEGAKQEGEQETVYLSGFTELDTMAMVLNNFIIPNQPDIEVILIRWESQ